MGWLNEIFSSSVGSVIESVGKVADSLITSDQERIQLKNELVKIQLEATLKANEQANETEMQITERWKSDNENLLTRAVRPFSYVWVIILFSAMIMTDGNIGQFKINTAYIPVIETLLVTMTVAYFGGRTFEKFKGGGK